MSEPVPATPETPAPATAPAAKVHVKSDMAGQGPVVYLGVRVLRELETARQDEWNELMQAVAPDDGTAAAIISAGDPAAAPLDLTAPLEMLNEVLKSRASAPVAALRARLTLEHRRIPDARPLWGRQFRPTARMRVQAWEAMAERVAVLSPETAGAAEEIKWLERELQYLRSWQSGIIWYLVLYQVGMIALLTLVWWLLAHFQVLASPTLSAAKPYLTAGFWGTLGACTTSLWYLVRHITTRTVNPDRVGEHVIKPLVGAFMGVLVALLVPAGFLQANQGTSKENYVWAVAALAGLQESTFMYKFNELIGTLFGSGSKSSDKPASGS